MKRIEIGNAVDAQDDSLAIDDELLLTVLQRRLHDPGISFCPTIAAACDQPYAVAIALNAETEAVLLDLVKPFRAGGNYGSSGGDAELKRLKHETKIGDSPRFCESGPNRLAYASCVLL